MPRTRDCDFCGADIEPGTGTMLVLNNGTTHHFCSAKCEKNVDLGREARDLEWTESGGGPRGPAAAEEPADSETEEAETEDTEAEPETEDAETEAVDADEETEADADEEAEAADAETDADANEADEADSEDAEAAADDQTEDDEE